MTPELKSKWLNALRSGQYQQGKHVLHRENTYCCLGVLCDIAGYKWDRVLNDSNYICLAGEECIENKEEMVKLGLTDDIHQKCYDMNDGTSGYQVHSFQEIANWLEENL